MQTGDRVLVKVFWLCAGLLSAPIISPNSVFAEDKSCGDLLNALHKRPAYIQFVDCTERTDLQDSPLEARYRVEGRHAAEAERYLVKEFKIQKMSRTCCVWESNKNFYREAQKRGFWISMGTDETLVDKRAEWPKIESFDITVDLFREEP
jgi:hypothetical protein